MVINILSCLLAQKRGYYQTAWLLAMQRGYQNYSVVINVKAWLLHNSVVIDKKAWLFIIDYAAYVSQGCTDFFQSFWVCLA
jgi:hypothetical protein